MKIHLTVFIFLLLATFMSWLSESGVGFKMGLTGLVIYLVWRGYEAAVKALSRTLRQRKLDRMPVYSAHKTMLKRTEKGAATQEKPLAELDRVLIMTTDLGPFICDTFLVLLFQDGVEWRVPLENSSYLNFYEALGENLPLDAEQALMGAFSTDCALFPLWERKKAAMEQAD